KTTLALLMAQVSSRVFAQISAVSEGMPVLREKIRQAESNQMFGGMLLFIDEIHRWNRTQQDALLPYIESGLILLVGATTENPSFSVNPALRSRCWIIELQPLSEDEVCVALKRGLTHLNLTAEEGVLETIASFSSRDVRRALSILERLAPSAEHGLLTTELLSTAQMQKDLLHDSNAQAHFNVVSAFIKSMRGSDPSAALYWMARMLAGGEDPMFVARRMVIFASEDIGNADLRALPLAMSAMQSVQQIGMPEARIILGQACTYLATAPKSNASYLAIKEALNFVRETGAHDVPAHIADPPIGYVYPHDHPYGYVNQRYWPDSLTPQAFYRPTEYGDEKRIKQRLSWWKDKTRKT
ncbi:MAG: replication-associated recombination protein A, partial [Myxococcota bacterium]|nr:replication-associated recombination protein A [Myxococcota bacterium]